MLAVSGLSLAQNVSLQEATLAADRFLNSQGKTLVRCAKTVTRDSETLLYIFNAENAFAVVSGDKSAQPVLAYVEHQLYNDAENVAPFEMWLNHYANQIEQIKKQHIVQPQHVFQWEKILSHAPAFRLGDEVEPLMLSKWDQDKYYNYYCPRDPAGSNGRVATGCVATAMAQLIYYFRFPETGIGSYSYTDENYGVQSADYGNTTYDFNAMCDEPSCINTEISKLIYHCGVGVDMHYGPNGSGMTNHSAARVLRTFFKYSPETEYLFRDSTNLNWDSVIVSHLDRRIPMYYAGWSEPNINGHGFICDGYKTVDSCYYFHFNFGWSGYRDGYFYTNSLYVGSYNFNLAQELIVNAYPDTTQYTYPTPQSLTGEMTLTAGEATFTDGNLTSENCASGMDFTWNIEPEVSNLTGISITIHYDLADGDTLYVFSEDEFNMVELTGDTGTFHLDIYIPNLQVRLVTHSANSAGFRAHYSTSQEVFCRGTQLFTQPTGNITDGSGTNDYNNFCDCKFRVMVSSHTAYLLHINRLDFEEGKDFLHFYNNAISESNHLLSLTGQIYDTNIAVNARILLLVMETDESGTASGFDIDYEASNVGVSGYMTGNLNVFPNPTNDYVTISYSEPMETIELFNADGRKILSETPNSEELRLSLLDLPAGFYMLTIHAGHQSFTRKLMKM
jgi:hypothetical protein